MCNVSHKFMKKIIIIGFILLTSSKCIFGQDHKVEELLLHGYSVGDTITDEFKLSKNFGPYFSSFKFHKDSTLEVHTIGNHISSFYYHLSRPKYEKSLNILKDKLGAPSIYYIGDTIYGVKLKHNIERFIWIDKSNYTEYSAYLNLDSIQHGFIQITNDSIGEFLKFQFIDGYKGYEEEMKPIEFDTLITN